MVARGAPPASRVVWAGVMGPESFFAYMAVIFAVASLLRPGGAVVVGAGLAVAQCARMPIVGCGPTFISP